MIEVFFICASNAVNMYNLNNFNLHMKKKLEVPFRVKLNYQHVLTLIVATGYNRGGNAMYIIYHTEHLVIFVILFLNIQYTCININLIQITLIKHL